MVCQVKITLYGPPKYNIGYNIFEISKQIFIKDNIVWLTKHNKILSPSKYKYLNFYSQANCYMATNL